MYIDKDSIIFYQSGAIDYTEQVNIQLSLTKSPGFTEIHPLLLDKYINSSIHHIQDIIKIYFLNIVNRIPHISDINDDIDINKRFTRVYYKCYKKFSNHHNFGNCTYTNLTLEKALGYIKQENLAICIPNLNKYK